LRIARVGGVATTTTTSFICMTINTYGVAKAFVN